MYYARCAKRGPTRTLCDVCFRLYGERRPETARHAFYACPHVQLLTDALGRAVTEATCADFNVVQAVRRRPTQELMREWGCVLVTGSRRDGSSTAPLMTCVRALQVETATAAALGRYSAVTSSSSTPVPVFVTPRRDPPLRIR